MTFKSTTGDDSIEVLDPSSGMLNLWNASQDENGDHFRQLSMREGEYVFLYAYYPVSLTIEDENGNTITPSWSQTSYDKYSLGNVQNYQVFCMPDSDVTITYTGYGHSGGGGL